jgi:thiol peroxidase
MANISLKGKPCRTCGELPSIGLKAPLFELVGKDLSDVTLEAFQGKNVVLNIFPSMDTPVCASSVRAFNEQAAGNQNMAIVNISMDLPFAQKRFCESAGIENVTNLSAFRSPQFGRSYGVTIEDGPLRGLLARAIVVISDHGEVAYTELVPEIAQEPNYEAALTAVAHIV